MCTKQCFRWCRFRRPSCSTSWTLAKRIPPSVPLHLAAVLAAPPTALASGRNTNPCTRRTSRHAQKSRKATCCGSWSRSRPEDPVNPLSRAPTRIPSRSTSRRIARAPTTSPRFSRRWTRIAFRVVVRY